MIEYVFYTKQGNELEEFAGETKVKPTEVELERFDAVCKARGLTWRVAEIDLGKVPDFAGAVNLK